MFNTWIISASLFIFRPVSLLANEVQGAKGTDGYIPCEESWSFFRGKCYKMFGGNMQAFGRVNWQEASQRCIERGGHLATVQSQEAQDFIFVFVSLVGEMEAWIGLNDLRNEAQYEWPDGTEFNYSNWNESEPSEYKQKNEDCVQMALQVFRGEPGKWADIDCKYPLAYICQADPDKMNGRSRDPTKCTPEEGGGWKYGDSCYNIVDEKKTWEDAEKYCQDKFKGHLLTILNFKMDYFLKYIFADFNTDIWLGIKMKDQLQQKFSSGWSVVHSKLPKISSSFVDGTCVVRRNNKLWEVVACFEEHPFVCETSKGPPVFENSVEEAKCPELPNDWRDLGGDFCYYIDTKSSVSWYQANFECNRRRGALASFHSKEEIDVLAPYVKEALPQNYGIFIGNCRRRGYDNVFVWADGSNMDFKYWDDGEPSNADEQCGEVFATNMKWNDVKCGEKKGYICSVRKISTKIIEIKMEDLCISSITFYILIGVFASILLLLIVLPVVFYLFGPWKEKKRKKPNIATVPLQPTLQEMYKSDGRKEQIYVNAPGCSYQYIY